VLCAQAENVSVEASELDGRQLRHSDASNTARRSFLLGIGIDINNKPWRLMLRSCREALPVTGDWQDTAHMSQEPQIVSTAQAPAAIGPYSQAVRNGGLLFCSGQIALDPNSGELVGDSAPRQARQCLENLQAICHAAGTSLSRALRMTLYMTDLSTFAEVGEVYGAFFAERPPARVTVGVDSLPRGAQIEIDAIVAVD
jgi:2-iminobutanoate/2-iminopropanoate deaminase